MNNVCVIFGALPWRTGYPLPSFPWALPLAPPTRVSPKRAHNQLISWYTAGFK